MHFPGEPGQGLPIHWSPRHGNWFTLRLRIDPLLTLRPPNLRGCHSTRDRAVTLCGPKNSTAFWRTLQQILASASTDVSPASMPDCVTSRDCHIQFFAVEECGILLLRGGIFSAVNCQAPAARRQSCAHRCHRELAIPRLARLR